MNGKYLFDTNAVVYYLQGRPEWVDFIDHTDMTERTASVITRMELLSYPGISPDEEERIHRFLSDLVVISLSEDIESAAIAIRRTARLKLPDAIIAATALRLKATLLTGDQNLRNLQWPGFYSATPT